MPTYPRVLVRSAAMAMVVFVAALLPAGTGAVDAVADPAGQGHLPNLMTRRPLGLRLRHDGGATLLRFSNTVANMGDGPLELRPESSGQTTVAYQRIFTHTDSEGWRLASEHPVGSFVFHPEHAHWHFEAFSEYQLRKVTPDGRIGRVLRETEDKVSFCVADSLSIFEGLAHASPAAVYPTTCSQDATQGLSVGWADRYGWQLPGQWVDVTGMTRGTYWLTSRADPLDLIDEADETDNRAALLIRISRDGVERV